MGIVQAPRIAFFDKYSESVVQSLQCIIFNVNYSPYIVGNR